MPSTKCLSNCFPVPGSIVKTHVDLGSYCKQTIRAVLRARPPKSEPLCDLAYGFPHWDVREGQRIYREQVGYSLLHNTHLAHQVYGEVEDRDKVVRESGEDGGPSIG
jgi:hypothetical protein